jgi:cellulose synthase/poly-beta-1,6-N-acetylglucosamine synthase-like glycosyltransferase
MYIDTFKKHLRDHIYKVDNNLIVNLNKIKKLKHSLSVEDYQKSLILNSNNILSKDSIEDMTKWFRDMRKRNKVRRVNNIPFIRMIEKKEKEIVDEFVKNEEYSIELLHQFGKRVNGWEYNKIKFNRIMAEDKKE